MKIFHFGRKSLSHYYSTFAIIIAAIVFFVLSISIGLEKSTIFLLEKVIIAVILAVSLNLVVGFLGELSLGHAGFMCLGAYLGGKFATIVEPTLGKDSPLNLVLSILIGGAVAAIFGLVIGLPALRLKGDYLAIVTLGFGEIVKSVFQNTTRESFGGALGLETPRFNKDYLFIYCFGALIISLWVSINLINSKHGRAITSIRDNEIAARATGINVTKYKLLAFTVSSFFAGVAGVLYSFSNYNVQSSKFGYNYSIEILVMVVLGGIGSINGSIIAAALITFINTELAQILTGNLAVLQNLFYAIILIVIVIYGNSPALAGIREKYDPSKLFDKKRKDPSTIKKDDAKWNKIPTKIAMDELLSVDVSNSDDNENDTNNTKGGN